MATLGGALFLYNGNIQDYCYRESIECLIELCDEVSLCVGGNDGSVEDVTELIKKYPEGKVKLITFTEEEWNSQQGREKLSYFSNKAIEALSTEWVYYQQADEVTTEKSFPFIRQAIESNGVEAFMVTRHNLWASPYTMLNVIQERKPVSTHVIRLTKTKYRCVDDAESIGVPSVSFDYLENIRMYHLGFVRDKNKHLVKIKHMQEKVFLWDVDKRIHDNTDGFDCWKWGFFPEDVVPIKEPLPKFIQAWAIEREVDPFKMTTGGYEMAVRFLKYINEWEHVSKHGLSTDGWSIVYEANVIWRRWSNASFK